jgi:alkylated DNA repair dioxygenase AlkB
MCRVTEHENENQMSDQALATCIHPNLFNSLPEGVSYMTYFAGQMSVTRMLILHVRFSTLPNQYSHLNNIYQFHRIFDEADEAGDHEEDETEELKDTPIAEEDEEEDEEMTTTLDENADGNQ